MQHRQRGIIRFLLDGRNQWFWALIEFALLIMEQRNKSYTPYQDITWHKDYAQRGVNPELRRLNREKSMPYEWTPAYRTWLKNISNNTCLYCGRRNCAFHIDHIIPVSWDKCPGATVDNGVWACSSCNQDRGNQDLATWHLDTFGSEHKTRAVVERVWLIQAEARKRFGPPDGPERKAMRVAGKAIIMRRLRQFNQVNPSRKGRVAAQDARKRA